MTVAELIVRLQGFTQDANVVFLTEDGTIEIIKWVEEDQVLVSSEGTEQRPRVVIY